MTSLTNYSLQNADTRAVGAGATILVVDDDPAMRMILGFSLQLFGYVMLSAQNGEEALALAKQHPEIRVILLDVVMCGLSGSALAGQLERTRPKASILFCSGHPASTLSRYGIDAGSVNFLQKPCRPPELHEKIESLLATG